MTLDGMGHACKLWHMRLLHAVALLGLVACTEPSKDEPFTPPPAYRVWYDSTQGCARVRGEFSRIRFYAVEDLGRYAGKTYGRDVFLVRRFVDSRFAVSHELLHTLIGDGHHRSLVWDTCHLRDWPE